jgi:hypothetical protein
MLDIIWNIDKKLWLSILLDLALLMILSEIILRHRNYLTNSLIMSALILDIFKISRLISSKIKKKKNQIIKIF